MWPTSETVVENRAKDWEDMRRTNLQIWRTNTSEDDGRWRFPFFSQIFEFCPIVYVQFEWIMDFVFCLFCNAGNYYGAKLPFFIYFCVPKRISCHFYGTVNLKPPATIIFPEIQEVCDHLSLIIFLPLRHHIQLFGSLKKQHTSFYFSLLSTSSCLYARSLCLCVFVLIQTW